MRYVALSTSATPQYAIYAPVVTRLWRHLGYEPITFLQEGDWDTELGCWVLDHLEGLQAPVKPEYPPLSPVTTVRTVRLTAAAHLSVAPDDFVIMADVDMAPLSRTFFELVRPPVTLLRGDYYGALDAVSSALASGHRAMVVGHFTFPMCYVGMTAATWRSILSLVPGDFEASMMSVTDGAQYDASSYDECTVAARLLMSSYSQGSLEKIDDVYWRQKDIWIVPMTDHVTKLPKYMKIGGDNRGIGPEWIDWHMPRPTSNWVGEALIEFWPEETDFIREYWLKACGLAGARHD